MYFGINGFPQDDKTRVQQQQGEPQGGRKVGGLTRQERISAFLGVRRSGTPTVSTPPATQTPAPQTGELSEAAIKTENFKNEVLSKMDLSKVKNPARAKYYLNKLLPEMQTLNGAEKNKLITKVPESQRKDYLERMAERRANMLDWAKFAGLEVVQDDKTGLYKLKVNGELLDVPERKVALLPEEVEDDEPELRPQIVD